MIDCIDPVYVKRIGQSVPCGKCNLCIKRKRDEWTFRLLQEAKYAQSGAFITLTYNEETVPHGKNGVLSLYKKDLQAYIKRLRINQSRYIRTKYKEQYKVAQIENKYKIRYYAIGEYGSKTERPHYHVLLFNYYPGTKSNIKIAWEINSVPMGSVSIGQIELKSIRYVVSDMINRDKNYSKEIGRNPEFSLMSRRPGIGSRYLEVNTEFHRQGNIPTANINGVTVRLPRFYSERIFSKPTRDFHKYHFERMAIEKEIKEVERLKKLGHKDPYGYMKDRKVEKNRLLGERSKKNKLNQI